ncbi:MAG: hypothetical protein HWE34_02100 [Methylocystaceae bacterium]|nr:hypothetical protein [Methylocystaceae bacterium]
MKQATALHDAFLAIPQRQRLIFENLFQKKLPKKSEITLAQAIFAIAHTFEHTPQYFPSKSKRGPKESLLLETLVYELGEIFYARTDKTWNRGDMPCITKDKTPMTSLPCFIENFRKVADPTQIENGDQNVSTLEYEGICKVLRRVVDKQKAQRKE